MIPMGGHRVERRTFIRNAGLVTTWAGISVILHGCSDDDPVAPAAGAGSIVDRIGAGARVQVLSSSNSGHSHTVTFN